MACGQQIRAYTRKGKEFLKIKTNLSETIQSLFVDETTIWTCGEFILNIYEGVSTSVKDAGFVMCPDRVHDLLSRRLRRLVILFCVLYICGVRVTTCVSSSYYVAIKIHRPENAER